MSAQACAVSLPPRLMLWAVGIPPTLVHQTLSSLANRAARWSGVDVFSDSAPAVNGLTDEWRIQWHEGRWTWAEAFAAMTVPADVPVAWLAAGTMTDVAWVRPLQDALQRQPALGTCSPLALGVPLHSPFFEEDHRTPDLVALNHWLRIHASAEALDLGRPLEAAGLMRHAAWQAICRDQDSPWPLTVARAGWVHGSSRHVCVALPGDRPFSAEDGCPSLSLLAAESLWRTSHPLTGLRYALSQVPTADLRASADTGPSGGVEDAPSSAQVVRLHVMHSWGGGLGKWVRDFCAADVRTGRGRGLLLKSVGTYGAFAQRLELHADHDGGTPLAVWELGLPIHATALAHLQVQKILDEVIERYGVSEVLVSSLIGHSLDVLRTGLPTVLVLHDHYPFCVTLYAQFDGECRQCDRQRLGRCIQENRQHRFFQGVHADDWQALREAFVSTVLRHRTVLAAPSPSVAQRWLAMMPPLSGMTVRVIEHGVDMPESTAFEPPTDGPLRVVVLGRLSPEKGRGLLAEILPAMAGWAEVLLLGCGEQADELKALPHVRAVAHFEHADLGDQIADWRPHLGLLTSTVPETFSYALSELWHCRVPVLACALGALADRIQDGQNGFLEPPHATALLARLRALHTGRSVLQRVRQTLHEQPTRDLQAMLHDYDLVLKSRVRARPCAASEAGQPAALPETTEPVPRGGARWLHVSQEATFMQALKGFGQYTRDKAAHSPRVPAWLRRWLRR